MTFEAKLVASATIFICKRSKTKVVLSFPFNSCESVYKFLYVIIRNSNPALLAISYGAIVLVAKRNSPPFWLTSGESSARKSTTELSICFQQKAEDPFQSSVPKRFLTEFPRCCCKCYCEINCNNHLQSFHLPGRWSQMILWGLQVFLSWCCNLTQSFGDVIIGSLSNDVFERRTLTGSCPFSFLGDGFAQIFSQIVSIRVKKLSNTNYIASRHITREKSSLPVDVRCSKTSLLKLPIS